MSALILLGAAMPKAYSADVRKGVTELVEAARRVMRWQLHHFIAGGM